MPYLTLPLTQCNTQTHPWTLPLASANVDAVSETTQGSNYLVTLMKSSIRIFNLQKPHVAAYMMRIVCRIVGYDYKDI